MSDADDTLWAWRLAGRCVPISVGLSIGSAIATDLGGRATAVALAIPAALLALIGLTAFLIAINSKKTDGTK